MRRRVVLNGAALVAIIAFVFWVCAFKVFDADFFWHVTAGRLMRQTGWLITTDPFAYTREGLPYLANHEWLAQVILSVVFDLFGSTGVILLRSMLVAAALVLVLLIVRKDLWIALPLAMLASLVIKGGAMDRPHLWTWVMVAAFLFLSARVLERGRLRWRDVAAFIILQILWVNLHGGAALLGVAITGALSAELIIHRRKIDATSAIPLLLALALMVSPLGWENIAYVRTLLTDETTRFIAEWQPRAWSTYLRDLWPFWLAALAALAFARKHLFFSLTILIATGFLSRTAYRHEMLFVIAGLAITFLQLRGSDQWARWTAWMHERLRWTTPVVIAVVFPLILHGRSVNRTFANRYHAHGYGIVDRTADVGAFLDREGLTGKVFNTYNLGSELLYHFFPERKVFVDGRNVDYGEKFLSELFAAATDGAAWDVLENRYGLAIAIVDIAGQLADAQDAVLPYVAHLQSSPRWIPVYLDDAVAVYLKDIPEHRDLIARARYHLLTPEGLLSGDALATPADPQTLVAELLRSIDQAPQSILARLLLARFLIAQGHTVDAVPLVDAALALRPDEYRPHEVLGLLRAREGKFDASEAAFDDALSRLSDEEARLLREYVARIFESLGQESRAARYR